MGKQIVQHGAVRYYRHGDEFWLDLITRWKTSGIGVRKFCEQNGVATSTFHKRRADLAKCAASMSRAASVLTPDACFIPVLSDSVMESATPVVPPVVAAPAKSAARDSVVISSGGMRIELTDAQEYTAHGAADGCDQETRRKLSQGICSRYSMSPSRR